MRRALIAGNSDLPPRALWEPWRKRAHRIIAADGGANRLIRLGLRPDDIVGDLDSVTPASIRKTRGRVVSDRDPNHTDLEKAIGFAHAEGYRDLTVIGASQGRLDHVLATVAVLMAWSRHVAIRLVDNDFTSEPVLGRLRFRAKKGTLVSLYAPTVARGVTTQGLRWPLKSATLRRGTLGIHNHVASSPVEVRVRSGDLLLMRGHRVEPHQ